ncbi:MULTISPECIES: DUF6642 family protein [Tenacibaculum]|uniref:DUF6642 family protein n=1 Tax=Tenacibaculum TaxID=104267 RepID=UPI001F416E11|nr:MULTISPECIES: DUF6642 family protein [Tenacibaculum]MCF2875783.1 hypothetical protein [Tenacibaculum sp. Cn5-1]MCF2935859.1 hypothetical protein [Tenacibaculum sp. Cn5-34]MCG7512419.1 hypothetical protein [Tenacibaculum sp. Cn5-46]
MLKNIEHLPQENYRETDYFIFCLEAVDDVEMNEDTLTQKKLEELTMQYGIASIYQTCDSIEGLEASLNTLVLDDHNFKNYEIIYFVITGEANSICLNDYYYSLQEIAEIFEGRLNDKLLHFSNAKVLDLDEDEAQYFLDITGAKGISGYGNQFNGIASSDLDKVFFNLFKKDDDMLNAVEELYKKHYKLCKLLDFRLYY